MAQKQLGNPPSNSLDTATKSYVDEKILPRSVADLRDWSLISRGQWVNSNGTVYTRASNTWVNTQLPFTKADIGKVVIVNVDLTSAEAADMSPANTRGARGRRWMSQIVDVDSSGRATMSDTPPIDMAFSGGRAQWGFDITTVINGALQELAASYATPREAYLCGRYRLSQLQIPMMTTLRGAGYGFNAAGNDPTYEGLTSTQLRQLPGSQKDFVVFTNPVGGTDYNWVGGFSLTDMIFSGPETNVVGKTPTIGNGIAFRTPTGVPLIPNEGIEMRRLWVAMFPESGFYLPAGAVPLYISDFNSEANGRYGVEYGVTGTTPVTQMLHLLNYSSGGNNLGGARFKNVTSIGTIIITSMKSECGQRYAPAGAPNYQYEAVIFEDCDDANVIINGLHHLRGWPDNGLKGPGPAIVIRQTVTGKARRPRLMFNAVSNRLLTTEDPTTIADTVTLRDEYSGVDIPLSVVSGQYPDGLSKFSNSGPVLNGAAIDMNVDSSQFSPNPLAINDLSYAMLRGSTVTVTKNGVATTLGVEYNNPDYAFAPDLSYMRVIPTSVTDTFVIEVTVPSGTNTIYGVTLGILATPGYHAKKVTIEAEWGGTWRTVTSVSKETTGLVWKRYNDAGANAITKVRYTLTEFATASSPCRIVSLWSANYTSPVLGNAYLPRVGGSLYGKVGAPPTLTAAGADANLDLVLNSKGTGVVKINDAPAVRRNFQTVTTATTLSSNGDYVVFLKSGAVPTLPTAVGNIGCYTIKNTDSSEKVINTTSSQTIDGKTYFVLQANASVNIVSDNTNWVVI